MYNDTNTLENAVAAYDDAVATYCGLVQEARARGERVTLFTAPPEVEAARGAMRRAQAARDAAMSTALYSVNGEDTCTLEDIRTANPDDPYVVEQAAALLPGEVWNGYHCQIERVR